MVQIVMIGILIGSVILLMPKKQQASPTVSDADHEVPSDAS
jgi:hypothetical protein